MRWRKGGWDKLNWDSFTPGIRGAGLLCRMIPKEVESAGLEVLIPGTADHISSDDS